MAVADTPDLHTEHDHEHDHGEFIAHHFDNAEQQFDSGKLGIWLFLVTEVLFFSGLFVAYTLYRNHHPEIFEQAHVFLNKYLGALNTVVLLFSSLTMAFAVRAAQLGKNKNCATFVLITMVCASMFLGVKAVEYSHKWDMGILVRSAFDLTYTHAPIETPLGQALHVSDYLVYMSLIPGLLLVGSLGASVIGKLTEKQLLSKFMLGMAIMVCGYFLGVIIGLIFMNIVEGDSQATHASIQKSRGPVLLHAMTLDTKAIPANIEDPEKTAGEHSEDQNGEHSQGEDHAHAKGEDHTHEHTTQYSAHHPDPEELSRDVGIFFSIYYCMTGLHAIHIIGGIIALSWLYWRSLLGHWRSDYFGPVDYVGLYWHLVDLIWIYLFPLLYLID